ncbi:hypothetical protein [Brevibacterium litoralis]|uniref:hypothetical protein n=1 Tax=Brevibacterium litoralis TaxID=3138935 RepID=UPI0032EBE5C3
MSGIVLALAVVGAVAVLSFVLAVVLRLTGGAGNAGFKAFLLVAVGSAAVCAILGILIALVGD